MVNETGQLLLLLSLIAIGREIGKEVQVRLVDVALTMNRSLFVFLLGASSLSSFCIALKSGNVLGEFIGRNSLLSSAVTLIPPIHGLKILRRPTISHLSSRKRMSWSRGAVHIRSRRSRPRQISL